jgi:uridine kinase
MGTFVAIIGGSGAGKTTVANKIIERFSDRSLCLNMDSYYRDLEPGVDPRNVNFDAPAAFDFDLFLSHLVDLKNGKPIEVPTYSFVTYRRDTSRTIHVDPKELTIVEGILVIYKKEIRKLFDLAIYVDEDADERLIRRIERDTKERGRSIESIIFQYRRFVAPAFRSFIEPQKYDCDIILPRGGENHIGLSIIKEALERMLQKS